MEPSPPPPSPPALPAPPVPTSGLHGQPHRGEETPEDRLLGVDGDDSDSESNGLEYNDVRLVSRSRAPHNSEMAMRVKEALYRRLFRRGSTPQAVREEVDGWGLWLLSSPSSGSLACLDPKG